MTGKRISKKVTIKKSDKVVKTLQNRTKISQSLFLKEYLKCRNISKSCEKAGIERQTYYLWMETEQFKNRFESASERLADVVEEGLNYYAERKNPQILMFLAKTYNRVSNRGYKEKSEVELSGQVVTKDLSEQDKRDLLSLINESKGK